MSLVLAAVATGAVALLVLRDRPAPADEPPAPTVAGAPEAAGEVGPHSASIRPYETTATLTEDLRDTLAGAPERVDRECWRVSRLLERKAEWMLENPVRQEASPRVRALLVLATGVHLPDDRRLHSYLDDPAPMVRRAVVLAMGHDGEGATRLDLMGVEVPVGRRPAAETRRRLAGRRRIEEDTDVRTAIDVVLEAGR